MAEWLVQSSSARSSEVRLRMGDFEGLTSQLTSPSFGRDVKVGVPFLEGPMPGCGMHSGPELTFGS